MNLKMINCTFATMLLMFTAHSARSASILTVFPVVSKSHFAVGLSLSRGLAKTGHNVTILTPYDYKSPLDNLEVVQLTGALEIAAGNAQKIKAVDHFSLPAVVMLPFLFMKGSEISNFTLTHSNVHQLMATRTFDLVIVDVFCTEATLGLAQHFGAALIGVSTFGASKWTNDLVGNPAPLSYVPHAFSTYSDKMSLWQRLGNTATLFYETFLSNVMKHRYQKLIYEKSFPNAKMTYEQTLSNVSLVLLNSHFSINSPRPYVPNMIEVGGMHVNRYTKPLPKNIQSFLDSATEGTIFFSLGSVLKSSLMSAEHKSIFVRVFGSLKQKVIWKFEEELDVPDNVMISSWLPQSDIFAHPNVKVFITHGGLLSTTEAVYHGIPVIGMPFFGDQKRNIEGYVSAGWALRLDYANVTESSLRWALNTMLTEKRFSDNARLASQRFRDQPMTPLETAVFWTEYVIRHGGAPHLRSASMNLNFVEYHNLDALLILAAGVGASTVTILWTIGLCFRKCCRSRNMMGANKKHD